jgi:hypothetical protein
MKRRAPAIALLTFAALTGFVGPCGAQTPDCRPAPRMPDWQRYQIKREMVATQHPGHKLGEYELDHIVPLCLGGSNERSNLQLQTWGAARLKDLDEAGVCELVHRGTIPCEEGRAQMLEWKPAPAEGWYYEPTQPTPH